ncbi:MAG: ImmA/IrrE family metallo-endopeptidase [Candidatus Eisenbacteria bacterium]|nr:ImmA/IrrE family metallo-endopeptidase [Candidatus Eisenbacteria bacterium]
MKRAVDKIIGILDRRDRTIYLDQTAYKTRRTFVTLHEIGHDYLPWQHDLYAFIEESDYTIDPETLDQFEQEANFFASEVLFQAGRFEQEARSKPLALRTAIDLSKRYGASCYATARRYVTTNVHPCALVVLEPPEGTLTTGLTVRPRRVICSPSFLERFGGLSLPNTFGPSHLFTSFALRSGFSSPQLSTLRRGQHQEHCLVEGFNTTYNALVLLYPVALPTPRR